MAKIKKSKVSSDYTAKAQGFDKVIISFFLIFVIIAIIILFQAPVQQISQVSSTSVTGKITSLAELTKIQYNTNEPMSGKIFLQLTQGTYPNIEILPAKTTINVLISGNTTKCAEKYVCVNGQTISWHSYNATTQECSLIEADPEGKCCSQGKGCNQIIKDNSFEASGLRTGGLRPDWTPSVTGLNPTTAVGVESGGFVDEYGVYSDYSAFANSLDVVGTPTITKATIKQDLSSRNVYVKDFTMGTAPAPIDKGAITFSSPPVSKAFKFAIRYSATGYGSSGYYFEIVVKALSRETVEHNLHYYYVVPGSIGYTPQNNTKDKYILIDIPLEDSWFNFTRQFYRDWITAFPTGRDDKIVEIELISHGRLLNNVMYGQKVNFDDITLTKYNTLSDECTARSTSQFPKKCCLEGSGIGSYYGEQLNCSKGSECWSSCMSSASLKIRNFIAKAEAPGKDKYNLTEGECGFISQGSWIDLEDYCGIGGDGVGKGYTPCLTNTSTCSGFGGINLYEVPISSLLSSGFKAPTQNGTYNLVVSIEYMPSWYEKNYGEDAEPIILAKTTTPFYVGVPVVSNCSDEFYDCVNAPVLSETEWTTCYANSQTKTKTLNCTYIGNAVCERYKAITITLTQNCTSVVPCTESDYSCTEWQPQICPATLQQTRQCSLINTACDPNATDAVIPETTQTCSIIPEEKPKINWIIYTVLAVVFLGAGIVFLVLKLGKKKEKGLRDAYPELTSYIRDALTTGATKQEIMAKIREAGWPKDAIETSFRAAMA